MKNKNCFSKILWMVLILKALLLSSFEDLRADESHTCNTTFETAIEPGDQDLASGIFSEAIDANLFEIQSKMKLRWTPAQVAERNEKLFAILEGYGKDQDFFDNEFKRTELTTGISAISASEFLRAAVENPVVAIHKTDEYDPEGRIGFCYGRATFVDLALRTAGVSETAIKKIWAVGSMTGGWRYHTATMVRLKSKEWVVLDPITNTARNYMGEAARPTPLAEWVANFSNRSADSKMMFFISDSEKFSPNPGEYSRLKMSLDNRGSAFRSEDYFFDMMNWFKRADVKASLRNIVNQ